MPVPLAEWIVRGVGLWLAVGVAAGIPFVVSGVQRVDPAARGATWGFRLLILPGVAALWPLVLVRWIRGMPPPVERTPHRRSR